MFLQFQQSVQSKNGVRRLSSDFHSGVKYINLVSNCKISLLWSHRRFRSFPISFSPRKFVSKGQRFLLTGTCCLCRWGGSPEADTLYLAVQCYFQCCWDAQRKVTRKAMNGLCIFAAWDKITFEYIMCLFPGVPCGCSRRIETPWCNSWRS